MEMSSYQPHWILNLQEIMGIKWREIKTRWCPQFVSVQLIYNSNNYGLFSYSYIVPMVYKPTCNQLYGGFHSWGYPKTVVMEEATEDHGGFNGGIPSSLDVLLKIL